MNFINRIKNSWFLRELLKTLSNNDSFFSSKRIERLILFLNSMILIDVYCYSNWSKITVTEILLIFSAQMVYAGYQVVQLRKDAEVEGEIEIKKEELKNEK